ncbi:MAG: hypothetical protein C0501_13610 [Isosphaera sp.]|nr:hypothetical protein [Isosphaera sp.]
MSVGQATTGDQFYVTHCVTADSVTNAPGYSVRAASAADPDALRRALEYPPYELPLDMWKDKPGKAHAPRRLSRVPHPDGGVWVVHTVYLEKDTMNRDRSYFSHLLHLPESVTAAAVLESWAADGWAKEYPTGATKTLRQTALPRGDAVSPAALSAFLGGTPAGPTDLASAVCPPRLRTDPAARKALAARFLAGVLRATAARNAGQARDRLFVHAEPGLTAMLLYAAARALPPAVAADLTFSTFEPAHRAIRDFTKAAVVGTWLGAGGKGLDPDLGAARGFALDALHPDRSSPELAAAPPTGVADLLDLAAAGEWELLDAVHHLIGDDPGGLAAVPRTIPLAKSAARLDRGRVSVDDLLALKADRRGAGLLARKADAVWAVVKDAAVTDARLRAAFRDWLADPERLRAYRHEACEALAKGDVAGWDARWAMVAEAADPAQLQAQTEKAQAALDDHLPDLSPAARGRLRDACGRAGVWPDHHLLAPTGPAEFDALLAPDSPPGWQGYACFAVMGPDGKNWLAEAARPHRPAMRETARRHLLAAAAPVLAGYAHHARAHLAADPGFLYDLLRPHGPESGPFLSRLIDAAANRIPAADWVKLLGDLDIYGQNNKDWEGFLLEGDHLAKLLAGFGADPAGMPVWAGYLDLIGPDLLAGDEWETQVFTQLSKAARALGAAGVPLKGVLPAGGPAKLNAAETVLAVSADPAAAARLEGGALAAAYQAFGMDPLDGLKRIYARGGFRAVDPDAQPGRLGPLVSAVLACYPITHEYFTARTAVTQWLALSEDCPEEHRAAFQALFVRGYVPEQWQADVLGDERKPKFHPDAEERIRDGLATERKFGGEKYTRPGRRGGSGDGGGYASPATRRAGQTKGVGGARRRGRGSGGVPILLWVAVAAVVVVGGVVLVLQLSKGSAKPTNPDTAPPPDPPKKVEKVDKDKKGTKGKGEP